MFKLPFGIWPGHWGLKGKTKEIAQIEYEYSGRECEEKLIELEYKHDKVECEKRKLELQFRHHEISKKEYREKLVEIDFKDKPEQLQKEKLKIQLEFDNLTELEYEKELANIEDIPWVHGELKGDIQSGFYFDMDWNDKFIEYLRNAGFNGLTEEEVVDMWLTRLYTNEAILGEWDNINQIDPKSIIDSNKRDDGKTEYK